jgi:hypothetical protein
VVTWHGPAHTGTVVNLGPLALIQPLLQQLDIAGIIDRHLPPDPQQVRFSACCWRRA